MAAIRLVQASDAEQMLAIYAPFIKESSTTFELEVPTIEQLQQRIGTISEHAPWLVCEIEGEILGYAYASKHRQRAAYQWSVESSVYVGAKLRRKGVGKALYSSLFQLLQLQGFYNVYAGITLPNLASVALHENLGFSHIGTYELVGYKLGKWHDVGWWQLSLQSERSVPVSPLSLGKVQNSSQWQIALSSGLSWLRV
ncbi:MAG: arsinothricin resistance N-acetyltransferase ArsN1 family B [Coleofasciculaceae cyanobacterium]